MIEAYRSDPQETNSPEAAATLVLAEVIEAGLFVDCEASR
jgi:hypothetical protein